MVGLIELTHIGLIEMNEKLIILGKDGCSGCENLKKFLSEKNISFEYVTDPQKINQYRKNVNVDGYPFSIVVNENDDIIEVYPYSFNNTTTLLHRFGGK